jgi:hypothetical protein
MNNPEYMRIEYLLTRTLIEYKQRNEERIDNNDEDAQMRMDEVKEASKLVDEMLSRAKLKALAMQKGEVAESKKAPAGAMRKTRTGFREQENGAAENRNEIDLKKWNEIRNQAEEIEEKTQLSKEVQKKLLDSCPGLTEVMQGNMGNMLTNNNNDINENIGNRELEVGNEDSEAMRSIRVHKIHRANVQKANLLIRCYAQLPYSVEPRLDSAEMKRIRAVIEAVLSGSYEVNI